MSTQKDRKVFSVRKRMKSFVYAFKGILAAYTSEHNLWIHSIAAALAIFLAFILDLSSMEWVVVILVIGLVFITEFINTAIEALVDLYTLEHTPLAGKIKDVAAAAVLLSAITAAIVGCIVFIPKILKFI